jgi:hypothetical protein
MEFEWRSLAQIDLPSLKQPAPCEGPPIRDRPLIGVVAVAHRHPASPRARRGGERAPPSIGRLACATAPPRVRARDSAGSSSRRESTAPRRETPARQIPSAHGGSYARDRAQQSLGAGKNGRAPRPPNLQARRAGVAARPPGTRRRAVPTRSHRAAMSPISVCTGMIAAVRAAMMSRREPSRPKSRITRKARTDLRGAGSPTDPNTSSHPPPCCATGCCRFAAGPLHACCNALGPTCDRRKGGGRLAILGERSVPSLRCLHFACPVPLKRAL